ncbi:hypothetical protein CYL21_5289 [Plasmodium falciparum NF54]|uniref:non-specific serine/threonine protein kinase n=23 Tax=cellular organisms TaxID=131567 RepID=A0A8S9VHN9_PLAFO|nr:hypothetical protein CYL21_5289 [Plasmodium falciparum NF54]
MAPKKKRKVSRILWHEMWHEGLEEASRLYFGERNVKGMFEVLEPLHAMMERGPQTLKETSFNQAYGRDLMEAQEWCRKYMKSGNVKDLLQAWDLYYHVFRRISASPSNPGASNGSNRKWFPAEPEDVRDYLLYLQARGLAVKTIQQHLGQLNMLHRRSGLPRPSDSNAVSLVMRRIRKENVDAGERAKQALAFERTDFDQVRSLMENSDRCQDIRNLAFLGIAYNTLLRIAEIARIRVKDISRTDGGRMLIHIGRTKTLVSTAGVEKALSLGVTKLVERWISVSGVADDPNNYLFCRVRKNGVAAPSATSQLSTRALEGIFEATHRLIYGAKDDSGQRYLAWSGHSARVGAARDMARAGVSIPEIMQAGGWTNVNIVMNYIRNLDSETGAMVRLLEDGD